MNIAKTSPAKQQQNSNNNRTTTTVTASASASASSATTNKSTIRAMYRLGGSVKGLMVILMKHEVQVNFGQKHHF